MMCARGSGDGQPGGRVARPVCGELSSAGGDTGGEIKDRARGGLLYPRIARIPGFREEVYGACVRGASAAPAMTRLSVDVGQPALLPYIIMENMSQD